MCVSVCGSCSVRRGLERSTPRSGSSSKSVSVGVSFNEPLKMPLLGMSLKKEADETLFLELALRGYDLSRLRDEEATAEILKIS